MGLNCRHEMDLIIDFIIVSGVFLNILVLLSLTRIKNKQLPHKILMVLWMFVLLSLIHFYAKLHQLDFLFIFTFLFVNGVRLFLAPLIYVYIQSVFRYKKFYLHKIIIHFIPFFVYEVVYVIPEVITYLTEKRLFPHLIYINQYFNQGLWQDLYTLLYLLLSLGFYVKAKRKIEHYSNLKSRGFLWVRNFLLVFTTVILLDFLLVIIAVFFGLHASNLGYLTIIALIISMLYLGYYGLTQSSVFVPDFQTDKNRTGSTFDEDDLNALKSKLEHSLMV